MTLAQLKSVVAAYHHKSLSDLTVGGVDLFLVAANNARRNAELRHNFEFARVAATLDITGASGGSLLNATITEGTATARVREITNVSRLNTIGDRRIPLDFTRADIAVERERSEDELRNHWEWYYRVPSDADLLNRRGKASVVQRGHQLFVYPIPVSDPENTPITLYLEGYGDLPDYTSDNLASTSAVVTGTLFPDITGTYLPYGVDTFGKTFYVNTGSPTATIEYTGSNWALHQQGDHFLDYFLKDVDEVTAAGTYVGVNSNTGTATVTIGSAIEPDFLLTYGQSYMQWETIIEMNYLFTTFVPRQEGNLSAPEKARDQAWENLLTWDAYMIDSAITRPR